MTLKNLQLKTEKEFGELIKGECEHKLFTLRYVNPKDKCNYCEAPKGVKLSIRDSECIKDFIFSSQTEVYELGYNAGLEKYNELIMAVSKKFPNETRHETALRYIKQAEQAELNDTKAKENKLDEKDNFRIPR